jgi:hypothetical protein
VLAASSFRATQRAWGWHAVQLELGDGNQLVKQLHSTRADWARAHFHWRCGGLAAVKASGAVYAVDHGLSDAPCQPLLPSSNRAHDGEVCGSHKVEEGSGR